MYINSALCMNNEINFPLTSQISIVACHDDDRTDFIVVFLGDI